VNATLPAAAPRRNVRDLADRAGRRLLQQDVLARAQKGGGEESDPSARALGDERRPWLDQVKSLAQLALRTPGRKNARPDDQFLCQR
jgi:hypothetical protein